MTHRLSESISEYVASRKSHGYATNTIKNDRQALDRLLVAAGNIPTAKLDANHIDATMAAASQTRGPGAMNAMQSSLAAFIKWAQQRGHLPRSSDPLAGRRYQKVQPRDRLRIPAADFGRVLDAAGRHHPRDRAIIAVGLFLMLRQSEARDLRVGDVNLADGEITVRIPKTKQVDVMPISSELDAELRVWLTAYTETVGKLHPEWFLLPTRFSNSVLRDAATGRYAGDGTGQAVGLRPLKPCVRVHEVVKRSLGTAGYSVERMEGMHTLRRSGARALFDELSQAGYDGALRTVQAMLHHASSTMTERYLGISLDKRTRDRKLSGKLMFPSLQADNVVSLTVASEG